MKKIIILIVSAFALFEVEGQVTGPLNYRRYDSLYLYSLPFSNGCATLDAYDSMTDSNWYCRWHYYRTVRPLVTRRGGHGVYTSQPSKRGYKFAKFAQPYYTDTLINVIGISAYLERFHHDDYHILYDSIYLEIRDSNLSIVRSIDMTGKLDSAEWYNWNRPYLPHYTEVFFDSNLYIRGKFYVVANGYRSGFEALYAVEGCDYDMEPLYTNEGFGDDTNEWHTTHCLDFAQFKTTKYYWPEAVQDTIFANDSSGISALYLFPILGEVDTTDSSCISQIYLDKYTHIFPNPANENLFVQCPYKIKTMEVYNSAGQLIERIKSDVYNCTINLNKYTQGEYIVKIITSQGVTTKKFIKQ